MNKIIGDFEIENVLLEKDDRCIYKAFDKKNHHSCFLKTLNSEYPSNEQLNSLKKDFELSQDLNSKYVLTPYELIKIDKSYVMVFDSFEGMPLKEFIKNDIINYQDFLRIAILLADALSDLHKKQIILKEFIPDLISIDPDSLAIKLLDISNSLHPHENYFSQLKMEAGLLNYISPELTGRMNSKVDHRSNIYSLGIILYEMVTHALPLDDKDPMVLVHKHITQMPVPPHEVNAAIPKAISDIIMKCLAKIPEDRYQNASGLKIDLETCLNQLRTKGSIDPSFVPGKIDVNEVFQLSNKIYARKNEMAQFHEVYKRTSTGIAEWLLICGEPGIGKGTFIDEICKAIASPGMAIVGKYEASQQHIPFNGFIHAFSQLIHNLLKEKEEHLETYRKQLLHALEGNGQLIIDVIPELEFIIGKQQAVPKLALEENRSRFLRLFIQFIQVFARTEHQLTIILEDLHLADILSFMCIKDLLIEKKMNHLLIIGTYVSQEVTSLHPLTTTIAEVQKENAPVKIIELTTLNVADVKELIADSLKTTPEKVAQLAELLYAKTNGNPFFINQLLRKLYEDEFVRFNFDSKEWEWEIEHIKNLEVSKNVVDLMLDKIKQFSIETQATLSAAAAIGTKFNVSFLSTISNLQPKQILNNLLPAVKAELIKLVKEGVLIADLAKQNDLEIDKFLKNNEGLQLEFINDRIHKASDSLSSTDMKLKEHYKIGKYLLFESEKPQNIDNHDLFFKTLTHLNLARTIITDPPERLRLAALNLKGCTLANASTAYALGLDLITIARELLPQNSWNNHYEITYSIFLESTSCSFFQKKFEQVELLSREILSHAKSKLDKGRLYVIKMAYYTTTSQYDKVIDLGIAGAALFHLKIPKEPTVLQILKKIVGVKYLSGRRSVSDIANLPKATNEQDIFIQRLMVLLITTAFLTSKHLVAYTTLLGMELILKNGYSDAAPSIYSLYGIVLESLFKDYTTANELGELSIKKAEEISNHMNCCRAYFAMVILISHWTHPLSDIKSYLDKCYSHGVDSGELFYLSYVTIFFGFADGTYMSDLVEANKLFQTYTGIIQTAKNIQAMQSYKVRSNFLRSLMNSDFRGFDMSDDSFNEDEFHNVVKTSSQFKQAYQGYIAYKGMLFNLFGYYREGIRLYEEGEPSREAVAQFMTQKDQLFYYSLNMIGAYETTGIFEWMKFRYRIYKNEKLFKRWAKLCPSSNSHRVVLIQAELARIKGYTEEAMNLYDQAIKLANENNFISEAGLANELAAKFYLSLDRLPFAKSYMREAYYSYYRWGALSKTAQLEELYPHLIESKISSLPSERSQILVSDGSQDDFDLAAVMRASSVLSKEIYLDKLLNEVLRLLIVEAGADRAIFLMEQDEKWVIQGEKNADQEESKVLQTLNFENHTELLSNAIINFVLRTREKVIINDTTSSGMFFRDSYLKKNNIKAVLCIPIISQGKMSAILYLENKASKDVFSSEKIRILEMLSAQIASSIENSMLYTKLEQYNRNLENKVWERTNEIQTKNQELADALEELKNTQHHLIESGKLAALGQLIAGIAHEINTPLGAVRASSQNASEAIKTILQTIPSLVKLLTKDNMEIFLYLIRLSTEEKHAPVTSKEERQIKKNMVTSFEEKKFANAYELVDILIDMGIYQDLSEKLKPIETEALGLVSFAYNLAAILKNNQNIQLAVERASKIIFALKAYIHQDSTENLEPSNITESIESVLTLYHHQLKHNVEVVKQYQEIPLVPCRLNEINQVWTNLIHNALQAMNQKGTLEVDIYPQDDWVIVQIIDSGKGIPEDVKAKIFTPFFTTKARGEGSGLGLSISKKIIDAHGGTISFESVPGRTVFSIKLPTMITQAQPALATTTTTA